MYEDKIQEVKRAFEEMKLHLTDGTITIDRLQSAIDALEPDKVEPINLKDLRKGDEIEDYAMGWGVFDSYRYSIHDIPTGTTLLVKFSPICWNYTLDGKRHTTDLRPSIIAVRRKPRVMKREVKGCIVVFHSSAPFFSPLTVEEAKEKYRGSVKVEVFPINETYEEPEQQ
jgi:hypothetical protein